MATITPVRVNPQTLDPSFWDEAALKVIRPLTLWLWETMGDADTGLAVPIPSGMYPTIQAIGTFGGATVTAEGSLDGTTWFTGHDDQANASTFTSAGGKLFAPYCWQVRVITSGGSGTDVDVYLAY